VDREPSREPPGTGSESDSIGAIGGSGLKSPDRAEPIAATSAIELVERIEVIVRENRPGLRLRVTEGALAGEVEIIRVGRGEVALSLQGRSAPVNASELERLRDELRTRGIRLTRVDS
jgi:hypothetical protein